MRDRPPRRRLGQRHRRLGRISKGSKRGHHPPRRRHRARGQHHQRHRARQLHGDDHHRRRIPRLARGARAVRVRRHEVPAGTGKRPLQTTSSVGSGVMGASVAVGAKLLSLARKDLRSSLSGAIGADVEMLDGRLQLKADPSRYVDIAEVLRRNGLTQAHRNLHLAPLPRGARTTPPSPTAPSSSKSTSTLTSAPSASPAPSKSPPAENSSIPRLRTAKKSAASSGASAWPCRKPRKSTRFGRIMNPSLQHYHVPVNADIHEIQTEFIEEDDRIVNPRGGRENIYRSSPPGRPTTFAKALDRW